MSKLRDLAAQVVIVFLVYALPLLLPAGIHAWPAAWVFLGLWFGFWLIMLGWLSRYNPALLQERMRVSTTDQQGWDRIFSVLINVTLFIWLLFISFDAARYHWSSVPVWLQVGGTMLLVCSFCVFFLTFRENSYLSPVVRIQTERGQTVVSTGPYHFVRHPMYAAMVVFMIGAPLLLGSLYGVLLGFIFISLLGRRVVLEEQTLKNELPGYTAYMAQVKYRLIPFIW